MRMAGSRMHVLDWLDSGVFVPSMNAMIRNTGVFIPASGERMPAGWTDRDEARFGKASGTLLDADESRTILDWWLAKSSGANVPNWDLACSALFDGDQRALVLVEAKAHVQEFTASASGKSTGNPQNDYSIGRAIDEAAADLLQRGHTVGISRDRWYQFSNRVAFAWKLASEGLPTVLIYLGFHGDLGISDIGKPIRNDDQWRELVVSTLNSEGIFPAGLWEQRIDTGGAPLWVLVRSRECLRQSRLRTSTEGFTFDEHGMPSDVEFWRDEISDAGS